MDAAECYGDHLAESRVGHAIAAGRDRWVVATMFGHRFHAPGTRQPGWDPGSLRSDHWSPDDVVRQLEESLRALGTDYVDLYQSHGGGDADVRTTGLWEALRAQVSAGKIRHLGTSMTLSSRVRFVSTMSKRLSAVTAFLTLGCAAICWRYLTAF